MDIRLQIARFSQKGLRNFDHSFGHSVAFGVVRRRGDVLALPELEECFKLVRYELTGTVREEFCRTACHIVQSEVSAC